MFLAVLALLPLSAAPYPLLVGIEFCLPGGRGSLNDLLLPTPGAGLRDFGTRDFPLKGLRDLPLDFGSTSGLVFLFSDSAVSFFFPFPPMENLVIFLSVVLSMFEVVLSCGETLPDFSEALALELAVCE